MSEWKRIPFEEDSPIQNGFDANASTGLTTTDSTLSFVDGTRTFTIQPSVTDFTFWAGGTKYTKTGAENVVIADSEGIQVIYYDSSGVLQYDASPDMTDIITNQCIVAAVYWDATNNVAELVMDERHGRIMDSQTHVYNHNTIGARFGSGLLLGDFTDNDGDGDQDADAQISVAGGTIWDEDLKITIGALSVGSSIPIFYQDTADGGWRSTATTFVVEPVQGGNTYPNFNEETAPGTWTRTEITNGNHVLTHYFGTGDINNPVIAVMGQAEYTSLALAQAGAEVELHSLQMNELASLTPEFVALGTVICNCRSQNGNAPRTRIMSTADGGDYIDWRNTTGGSSSGATVNDHNTLTGLQGGTTGEYYHFTSATHTAVDGLETGTANKFLGYDGSGDLAEKDAPATTLANLGAGTLTELNDAVINADFGGNDVGDVPVIGANTVFEDATDIGTPAAADRIPIQDDTDDTIKFVQAQNLPYPVDTSGTPVATDFARFTDADTIEGRSPTETISDLGLDADLPTFSVPASTTISTFGASLVDDADAATARTTLDVDQAGTDNSTDVTLAGTPDYITISGQEITRNTIVATTDLSATGTKDSTTFLRGDDTWAVPSGGGGGGTADALATSTASDVTVDNSDPDAGGGQVLVTYSATAAAWRNLPSMILMSRSFAMSVSTSGTNVYGPSEWDTAWESDPHGSSDTYRNMWSPLWDKSYGTSPNPTFASGLSQGVVVPDVPLGWVMRVTGWFSGTWTGSAAPTIAIYRLRRTDASTTQSSTLVGNFSVGFMADTSSGKWIYFTDDDTSPNIQAGDVLFPSFVVANGTAMSDVKCEFTLTLGADDATDS